MIVGRLAPTPSGRLHLGNVTAFGCAWLSARARGGRLLLRMEDVDRGRARADVERSIREDLAWLGVAWDEETPPQRDRDYAPWLARLADRTYRCACTRAELAGGGCSGRCREAGHAEGSVRFRLPDGPVDVVDRARGHRRVDPAAFGDPVLCRRDGVFAYNLAVVVDDLCDGVSEVVRGADLLDYTAVQIRLWEALGATPPTWLHAPLILGTNGRKLSKSHGSTEIAAWRAAGRSPAEVWRTVLPWLGLPDTDDLQDAARRFDPARIPAGPFTTG